MPYYEFRQNNSGGDFEVDDKITIHVWVEANNADEANAKAEEIGIYFEGVDSEMDCSCCGDRWYRVDDIDAELFPRVVSYGSKWVGDGENHTIIYHADGTVGKISKEVIQINE